MGNETPTEYRSNLTPEQQRAERLGWIIDQLSMASLAKGQVCSTERLRINAEDLLDVPQEHLAKAFVKARRELDYIPGVAELRRLAQADDAGNVDADMRAAWDAVTKHVAKWGRWNSERDRAHLETDAPELPERIVDTVRRTGGWTVYLGMDLDSFPFQQKRFFDEYKAWVRTERAAIDLWKSLPAADVKQLAAAKTMALSHQDPKRLTTPGNGITGTKPRRIEPELTPEDLQVRREAAKARLAEYLRAKTTTSGPTLPNPDAPA